MSGIDLIVYGILLTFAHRTVNIIRHVYTACTSRLCLYIYRGKEKS